MLKLPPYEAGIDTHKHRKDTFIIYDTTGLDSTTDPADGIMQEDGQWHRNNPYGA